MASNLLRPLWKKAGTRDLVVPALLAFIVAAFVVPGDWLLQRAFAARPLLRWGIELGTLLALLAAFVLAPNAFALLGHDRKGVEGRFQVLRRLSDSVGLVWLNIALIAAAVLTAAAAASSPYPGVSLVLLAIVVVGVATVGADVTPGTEVEAPRRVPADLDDITLPLASREALLRFEWECRRPSDAPSAPGLTLRLEDRLSEVRHEIVRLGPHDPVPLEEAGRLLDVDTNPEVARVAATADGRLTEHAAATSALEAKWNILCFAEQFSLEPPMGGGRDWSAGLRFPTEVLWLGRGSATSMVLLAAQFLRILGLEFGLACLEGEGEKTLGIAIPGFEHIGKAGDLFVEPRGSRPCVLVLPALRGADGAAGDGGGAWSWQVVTKREADDSKRKLTWIALRS
jgi:hypothetical protein